MYHNFTLAFKGMVRPITPQQSLRQYILCIILAQYEAQVTFSSTIQNGQGGLFNLRGKYLYPKLALLNLTNSMFDNHLALPGAWSQSFKDFTA